MFKPMLAASADKVPVLSMKFPFLASPKLDGIRCVMRDGKAYSRTLKLIPNDFVQSELNNLSGLCRLFGNEEDGELIVGPAGAKDVYRVTNSGVMSRDGEPDFKYHVFDLIDSYQTSKFELRYERVREQIQKIGHKRLVLVPHLLVTNMDELLAYEAEMLMQGYEGVMLRRPDAVYKFGRSTPIDQGLIKFKRFTDDDAEIVGFGELMINQNEQTKDELGHAKRSTSKENLVGGGVLGYLTLRCRNFEMEFNIGTGLTYADREEMWKMAQAGTLIGKWVKFKYQPIGVKDVPRFPVFLGFREDVDGRTDHSAGRGDA